MSADRARGGDPVRVPDPQPGSDAAADGALADHAGRARRADLLPVGRRAFRPLEPARARGGRRHLVRLRQVEDHRRPEAVRRRARRVAGPRRPRRAAGEDVPGGAARGPRPRRGADRDLRQPRPYVHRGRGAGGLRDHPAGRRRWSGRWSGWSGICRPTCCRRARAAHRCWRTSARWWPPTPRRRWPSDVPFERRFTARLPFGACVGRGAARDAAPAESDWPAPLHPDERAFARASSEPRRAAWIGGRVALRAALDAAGLLVAGAAAGDGARGAAAAGRGGRIDQPQGRPGRRHRRAVPGRSPATLGIDLEQLRPLRADVSARVLTPRERAACPRPARSATPTSCAVLREGGGLQGARPLAGPLCRVQRGGDRRPGRPADAQRRSGAVRAARRGADLAPDGYELMTAVARDA